MKDNIKQRSNYWDNMKGILILLVVFSHFLYQIKMNDLTNNILTYIYMFHMPVFIFISGYFGKNNNSSSIKSISKLIFIYIIFNSIMIILFKNNQILIPMFSYWYILALVVWRLITPHIIKNKSITIILFIIGLIVGFYPSINNTLAISRTICFYPYYLLGYFFSAEKSNKIVNKNKYHRLIRGVLLLLITSSIAYMSNFIFKYSIELLEMYNYIRVFDLYGRLILYVTGVLSIYIFIYITPPKKIPLLTMFGRNSLTIFVFHRLFTIIGSLYIENLSNLPILLLSIIMTFIICITFGNDQFSKLFNIFVNDGVSFITENNKKLTPAKISLLCILLYFIFYTAYEIRYVKEDIYINPTIMTKEKENSFENAFKITFAGDLILLEDQVKLGYKDGIYNYDDVFENTKKYISSADLAIGVLEGPLAGEKEGYSTGNFNDNKKLYLNFPDEYANSIKEAGFDLVTTANNHFLDKGKQGVIRTIDVLESINLDHTGTYKDKNDKLKNHIKIIEKDNLKFAILSYTYGSNYMDQEELINGKYSNLTSIIFGTSGKTFNTLKKSVEEDFIEAKSYSPDFIIVLPHIGTQFSNEIDKEQKVWYEIFKENGADIILGDHSHTVQPIQLNKYNEKIVFEAYSPGNFSNIYRDNQGDTSVLINVYIDKYSKDIIGGSVVPLYTYATASSNYHPTSIYDLLNDESIYNNLSTDDIKRINKSNEIITKVLFNSDINISNITDKYYFDTSGLLRNKVTGININNDIKEGILYKNIEANNSICFIGDSITEGSRNGGVPWYEPIEELFPNKKIINYSKGGSMVSYMIEHIKEIPKTDLYVIAIGVNDIRFKYRDNETITMNANEYIKEIDKLKQLLKEKNNNAKFIFIAPWYTLDGDINTKMSYKDIMKITNKYSNTLEEYCKKQKCDYINPNAYLKNVLNNTPDNYYLVDCVHPNSTNGVILYSEAVLSQKYNN